MKIKITSCLDGHRWYADNIGVEYTVIPDNYTAKNKEYKVFTGTHTNFIRFTDCIIVPEVEVRVKVPEASPSMKDLPNSIYRFHRVLQRALDENHVFLAATDSQLLTELTSLERELERLKEI